MNNTRTTKRALLSSVIAVLICVAMLIGTTFAWFTDSASTAVNKIQAGTLDVQLLDENGNSLEGQTLSWQKAAGAPDGEQVLWEPGCTYKLQPITIKNAGNLALKYKVVISGIKGSAKLNEVIDWTISGADINTEYSLTAGASNTLTIEGHMQETAGNEYQGLSIDGIGITVVATQLASEYDSINNTYDTNATYLNQDADDNYLISNANELVYFAKSVNVEGNNYAGKTVKLTANIDLAGKNWIPVGQTGATQFQGIFDGQNYTIKNMTVNNPSENPNVSSGFFGWIEDHGQGIKVLNVKFDNASVTGSHYVGVVSGYVYGTIKDCVVENSTVVGINMNDDANGDKVGGIVGYVGEDAFIDNNKVDNCSITGNRDIGGIVGAVATGVDSFSSNSVTNTTLTYATIKSYASAGEIVSGRTGFAPDSSNTATNVTVRLSANVSTSAELVDAMTAADEYVEVKLCNDIAINIADLGTQTPGSGEYKLGGTGTKSLVIDGNSHKMTLNTSYMSALGMKNSTGELIFKNIDLTSVGNSAHTWNIYDFGIINVNSVKFANVNFDKPLALSNVEASSLKNVSINLLNNPVNHSADAYALWITSACSNVEIDGLIIDATDINSTNAVKHRAIKIADEYVDLSARKCIELNVSNATIKSEKKAAILVTNTAGANITLSNIDITNVAADTTNVVWIDNGSEEWKNAPVTVNGGNCIVEP